MKTNSKRLLSSVFTHRFIMNGSTKLSLILGFIFIVLCFSNVEAKTTSYWDSVTAIVSGNNFYDILGVDGQSTLSEIKKAFRKLSKEYHPDHNPSAEAKEIYLKVITAFQVLSNQDSKQEYDHLLTHGVPVQDKYYGRYAHSMGIPEHNPWIVYPALFIVATAVRHLMLWNHYNIMMKRVKASHLYKTKRNQNMIDSGVDMKKIKKERKQRKLAGKDSDPEDDPYAPPIHIYGAEKPTFWDLLPFAMVRGIYNFIKTWNDPPLSDVEQLRRHMEIRDQVPYTLQQAEEEMQKMKMKHERLLESNKYKRYLRWRRKNGAVQ